MRREKPHLRTWIDERRPGRGRPGAPGESMPATGPAGPIVLCLGPTNTGKTHRAVERMLEHETGMLGLPLRLLARELYDRICQTVGQSAVALITGEEKRTPKQARYFVCTVEAMPLDRRVDFVCVDEIQLAAHPERGHVFTDRLLHARGRLETWFLGSDSMVPLCRELLPGAELRRSPRLSVLKSEGEIRMGTLKPRAAVVAFSMSRVYELAERVKARRGGVAVVLGALSPRARNAQVALYEAGEVDYLVATDAIGMGLNLDLQRVVFAETRKFDGHGQRDLTIGELAQIAGRAGRHQRDGYFGTFAPEPSLPHQVTRALENHRIPAIHSIYHRSRELDFASIDRLLTSLNVPAALPQLEPIPLATDSAALRLLKQRPEVICRATSAERVALLWEVCQVPDYRKTLLTDHTQLLEELYLQLVDGTRLSEPYFHQKMLRLRQHHGDLDSLLPRLAACRTLSYISGRADWVSDSVGLRSRLENLEDELSDALHQALTARFVRRLRRTITAPAAQPPTARRPSHKEALSALREQFRDAEAPSFVDQLSDASHDEIQLDAGGRIRFGGEVIASLIRGRKLWSPDHRLITTLAPGSELRARRRLRGYVQALITETLGPLAPQLEKQLSAAGRGLCYQLKEGLGCARRGDCEPQLRQLTSEDRHLLKAAGLKQGRNVLFFSKLLAPDALLRRSALVSAFHGRALPYDLSQSGVSDVSAAPPPGMSPEMALPLGYVPCGSRWLRADFAERLATTRDPEDKAELQQLLACQPDELERLREMLLGRRGPSGRGRRRRPRGKSAKRMGTVRPSRGAPADLPSPSGRAGHGAARD